MIDNKIIIIQRKHCMKKKQGQRRVGLITQISSQLSNQTTQLQTKREQYDALTVCNNARNLLKPAVPDQKKTDPIIPNPVITTTQKNKQASTAYLESMPQCLKQLSVNNINIYSEFSHLDKQRTTIFDKYEEIISDLEKVVKDLEQKNQFINQDRYRLINENMRLKQQIQAIKSSYITYMSNSAVKGISIFDIVKTSKINPNNHSYMEQSRCSNKYLNINTQRVNFNFNSTNPKLQIKSQLQSGLQSRMQSQLQSQNQSRIKMMNTQNSNFNLNLNSNLNTYRTINECNEDFSGRKDQVKRKISDQEILEQSQFDIKYSGHHFNHQIQAELSIENQCIPRSYSQSEQSSLIQQKQQDEQQNKNSRGHLLITHKSGSQLQNSQQKTPHLQLPLKSIVQCKSNNNQAPLRIFYLLLLQQQAHIQKIRQLLNLCIQDDSKILLHLLPNHNQLWGSIIEKFLQQITKGEYQNQQQIIEYISSNPLIDMLLVSLLKQSLPVENQDQELNLGDWKKEDINHRALFLGLANQFDLRLQTTKDSNHEEGIIYNFYINNQHYASADTQSKQSRAIKKSSRYQKNKYQFESQSHCHQQSKSQLQQSNLLESRVSSNILSKQQIEQHQEHDISLVPKNTNRYKNSHVYSNSRDVMHIKCNKQQAVFSIWLDQSRQYYQTYIHISPDNFYNNYHYNNYSIDQPSKQYQNQQQGLESPNFNQFNAENGRSNDRQRGNNRYINEPFCKSESVSDVQLSEQPNPNDSQGYEGTYYAEGRQDTYEQEDLEDDDHHNKSFKHRISNQLQIKDQNIINSKNQPTKMEIKVNRPLFKQNDSQLYARQSQQPLRKQRNGHKYKYTLDEDYLKMKNESKNMSKVNSRVEQSQYY